MKFELSAASSVNDVEDFCRENGWLEPYQNVVGLEIPGEGNMNVVVRAKLTDGSSLILKQPRTFVRKYPQIPAPFERTAVENQFYNLSESNTFGRYMAQKIGFDTQNSILVVEDLGETSDYSFLYQPSQTIAETDLQTAVAFLSHLHNTQFSTKIQADFPTNLALRKLNHEHLFVYPFMETNGFNLDTIQAGLQETALTYKTNETLKNALHKLGQKYLSAGNQLIHGDFYPGSLLKTPNGLRVIDPEFCFFGQAEYDLGVFIAHLKMASQPAEIVDTTLALYQQPAGFKSQLMWQFVGMEMFRRMIGLAQVPLTLDLEAKQSLLQEAENFILTP